MVTVLLKKLIVEVNRVAEHDKASENRCKTFFSWHDRSRTAFRKSLYLCNGQSLQLRHWPLILEVPKFSSWKKEEKSVQECAGSWTLWTHLTESTERQIWLQCICWQRTVPNTCIANITSHLHAIIRPHQVEFDISFWPISALMSKTIHRSQIWHLVLSVKYCMPLINLNPRYS